MTQLDDLENTFLEEYEAAHILITAEKYKSATILLAKAFFAIVDLIIFKKYHQLPKNHAERFRILEQKEPKIYTHLHDSWGKYTDTYTKPSAKDSINLFKTSIHGIIKNENTSKKITTLIETTH